MSLFGDPNYQYRETYFVLFENGNCPSSEELIDAIGQLGNNFHIVDSKINEGRVESITVDMSEDFAALDITYVEGDEVRAQVDEIGEELRNMTLQGDEIKNFQKFGTAMLDLTFSILSVRSILKLMNSSIPVVC